MAGKVHSILLEQMGGTYQVIYCNDGMCTHHKKKKKNYLYPYFVIQPTNIYNKSSWVLALYWQPCFLYHPSTLLGVMIFFFGDLIHNSSNYYIYFSCLFQHYTIITKKKKSQSIVATSPKLSPFMFIVKFTRKPYWSEDNFYNFFVECTQLS